LEVLHECRRGHALQECIGWSASSDLATDHIADVDAGSKDRRHSTSTRRLQPLLDAGVFPWRDCRDAREFSSPSLSDKCRHAFDSVAG